MRRRRSPPPRRPRRRPRRRRGRGVRRVCPFTGWRGGRWRWWAWPGSCGCGRWHRWWRWRGWVSGWCWWVGGWCRRRGGRGGSCPASRRGEPASPASPARGLAVGVSGWAASSPRGVLAVERCRLRLAVPVERHAVGPGWLRPAALVDPSGHVEGPWGLVLARGAPVSPVAKRGDGEGADCPGRRVAPRQQWSGVAPVPVVHCLAWPGAALTVATVQPVGTKRAAEGWRRRLPAALRRRRLQPRAEARSVRFAAHSGPPPRGARCGIRGGAARPRLGHPPVAAAVPAFRPAKRGDRPPVPRRPARQARGLVPPAGAAPHPRAAAPAPPPGACASRPPGSVDRPVRASTRTPLHARGCAPATPRRRRARSGGPGGSPPRKVRPHPPRRPHGGRRNRGASTPTVPFRRGRSSAG